ncbi:MAG TPA: hypothetical protein PKD72_05120, partial [Gemmatales bacterium]|nr:hypothetical protein [Gemmatales bacterium]
MSFLRRRFFSWLRGNVLRGTAHGTCIKSTRHRPAPRRRLQVEGLEDRLTPANTLLELDFFGNLLVSDIGDGVSGFNDDNFIIASDVANSRYIIS